MTALPIEEVPHELHGHALAGWRKARSLELAMAGQSYDEIAEQVGYANRGNAWRAVDQALSESVAENAEQYRALTLARLEKLLASHWVAATELGETKAADMVLKVIAAQIKLLGLDGQAVVEQGRTVVISGNTEEYIASLKAISARTGP